MLGGGFAYGVVTSGFALHFSNIYDRVADSMVVPHDLSESGFCLYDVQGLSFGMLRKSFDKQGPSWVWSDVVHGHEGVRPRQRYVVIGTMHPKRYDLLGEEIVAHLPPGEEHGFPGVATTGAPFNSAMIEIAVKRLDMTPKELIAKWRAGEYGDRDVLFEATAKVPKGYSRRR